MIRNKILLLFAVFITSFSALHAQKPFYEVIANVDTVYKTVDVSTNINIPSGLKIPGDTVWCHLWANAYSNTRNEFTKEQLKFGFTSFYFRDQNKLSEIKDIQVTIQRNPISYVFKDDDKEILGVIVGSQNTFSGNITIEYQLKLPAMVNGLGYEKGNFYLRNFYPKIAIFEKNMWQTYHYTQFADEWGYDSDVLLKLYGLEGFVPFSNGSKVNANNPLTPPETHAGGSKEGQTRDEPLALDALSPHGLSSGGFFATISSFMKSLVSCTSLYHTAYNRLSHKERWANLIRAQ